MSTILNVLSAWNCADIVKQASAISLCLRHRRLIALNFWLFMCTERKWTKRRVHRFLTSILIKFARSSFSKKCWFFFESVNGYQYKQGVEIKLDVCNLNTVRLKQRLYPTKIGVNAEQQMWRMERAKRSTNTNKGYILPQISQVQNFTRKIPKLFFSAFPKIKLFK